MEASQKKMSMSIDEALAEVTREVAGRFFGEELTAEEAERLRAILERLKAQEDA